MPDVLAGRVTGIADARIGGELGPDAGIVGTSHVHLLMQHGGAELERVLFGLVHARVKV